MIQHVRSEPQAHNGRVRDELRLHRIQHCIVGAEHAVNYVLGQPLEVGAPVGEEVGDAVRSVERGEEGGAFFAGGWVEMDMGSVALVNRERWLR